MSLNLKNRDAEFILTTPTGANPLDVTAVVKSFTVGNDRQSESGIIATTGTLILHAFPVAGFAESLNPRRNPARFAPRCQLSVRVANESGALVAHPRGALRILKYPEAPSRRNTELKIEVGCLLSLQDYRQPSGDESGVTPGIARSRTQIINTLAALAKLPDLTDPIAEWEIDYPLPRLNGSYIAQMGQIAFSAGYVLWIDNEERLRAKRIPTNPEPIVTFSVGSDDSTWDNLTGQETPCEIIRTTCTYPKALPTLDPEPQSSVSRDTNYSPSDISYSTLNGTATATPVSFRRSRRPLGMVMPDSYPDSPFLTTAEMEYNYSYYEEDDRGFLLKTVRLTVQPLGVIMPQFYPGDQTNSFALRETKYYEYLDEVTIKVTTYTEEPQGVIDPANTASASRTSFGQSGYAIEYWRKVNNGWQKVNSSRSFKVGDSSPSSGSTFSNGGDNTPPAPEQRQQPFYTEDTQVSGRARFQAPDGFDFDRRPRPFQVEAATEPAQLNYVAKLIGQRLWGQVQGITFATDLRDEFNGANYEPLACVDWIEIDDFSGEYLKNRYIVTGESFAITQRQCAMAADGLHLGAIVRYRTDGSATPPTAPNEPIDPNEAEYLDRPYREISESSGTLTLVGGFNVYPYALTTDSESFGGNLETIGSFSDSGEPTVDPQHYWSLEGSPYLDSGTVGGIELIDFGTISSTTGYAGNAVLLGVDGVLLGDPALSLNGADWEIQFYFRMETLASGRTVLSLMDDPNATLEWELTTIAGVKLRFRIANTAASYIATVDSDTLTNATWHLIRIAKVGSNIEIQVDAGTTNTASISGTPHVAGTDGVFTIGFNNYSTASSLDVKVDEVKVFI